MNKQELAERVAEMMHPKKAMSLCVDSAEYEHDCSVRLLDMEITINACLSLFDLLEAEGLRVVPAEPTEAMVEAARGEWWQSHSGHVMSKSTAAKTYKAMLEAASIND